MWHNSGSNTGVDLFFFLEDTSIFCCIRILIITIESESGDKINVTHNWGPQKGVCEAKSLGNPVLDG